MSFQQQPNPWARLAAALREAAAAAEVIAYQPNLPSVSSSGTTSEPELLTRNEAARLANCDPSTIHRAITDPACNLRYTHERGRRKFIHRDVFNRFLEEFAIPEARGGSR